MKLVSVNFVRGALLTALAGAVVVGLVACEPRLAATGEKIEPTGQATGENLAAARQSVNDATLAVNVRAALIAAPGLNATTIDVNASDGAIILLGTTDTSTKRDLAGYVALKVEGVKTVRNRIVVIKGS